jgi:hypothetical protein
MVSHKEVSFEKLVQNKSVAVVGNSLSLFDKLYGMEIDSHDIVIKFNKPAPLYCENNVTLTHGKKMDVWAFWAIGAFVKRTLNEPEYEKMREAFFNDDGIYKIQAVINGHRKTSLDHCDFTYNNSKFEALNVKVASASKYQESNEKRSQHLFLRNQSLFEAYETRYTRRGFKIIKETKERRVIRPSIGITVLEWLSQCEPSSVDIYGMDFKKTPTFSELNLFDKDIKCRFDVRCMHNFALEEAYARKALLNKNNFTLRD